jgi:hypothetical protein
LRLTPFLLRAFGDVQVADTAESVRSDNVVAQMQAHWSPPPDSPVPADWWEHRKDFMGQLLEALIARVKSGDYERTSLGLALWEGLSTKSILIHLDDVDAQSALQEANWAGELAHDDGDHLLVVDSNVGFNKVNANVTEAITYTVTLNPNGGDATLEIAYDNTAAASNEPCDHRPYYGSTYADLQQRCYWDYLRVLAPVGSHLKATDGLEAARVVEDLSEVTAFQGYFVLERNAARNVRFQYALPSRVSEAHTYKLTLQKQAGAPPRPVHVQLRLPTEWSMGASNVEPTQRAENLLTFDVMLNHDTTIVIGLNKTPTAPVGALILIGLVLLGAGALVWRRSQSSTLNTKK